MLPQSQLHHHSMPPDPHASHRQHLSVPTQGLADCRHRQTYMPSATLSFPIRTSQKSGFNVAKTSTSSGYLDASEHSLRRKTPNGTIDAAYDASPSHFHPHGPPPPKQMAVATSSLHSPRLLNTTSLAFSSNFSAIGNASEEAAGVFEGVSYPWLLYKPPGISTAHGGPMESHLWQHHPGVTHQVDAPAVQPVLRANEYNVRAFCPPPAPPNTMLPFGQGDWSIVQSHGLGDRRIDPTYTLNPPNMLPMAFQPLPNFALLTPEHMLHQQANPALDSLFDSKAVLAGHVAQPGHAAHPATPLPQPGFRDKILAQGHSHYMQMLAYAQSTRKYAQDKSLQLGRGAGDGLLYPKPPNPTHRRLHNVGRPSQASPSDAAFDSRRAATLAGLDDCQSSGHGSQASQRDLYASRNFHFPASTTGPAWGSAPPSPAFGHIHSCAHKASSSLNILNSLCEESGWKWIEGILLGGCLLYALERYGAALDWFARITALDPHHVESITNAAAALYCLDRRQEAEQHWLRAVKLRPSYLEAAEHLVGLLYRKRSKDAIDVVTYVQDALKVSKPGRWTSSSKASLSTYPGSVLGSHASASLSASDTAGLTDQNISQAQGYGSSGYALPGKENGRILALVHAKATMLYGLKEIDAAAESFEEAVLISVGRDKTDVYHLVRCIQAVLMPRDKAPNVSRIKSKDPALPLLLSPEMARQTARLVFSGSGELPGLALVASGTSKRAATQTTSNSLLSLAKIFQDAISHGGGGPRLLRGPPGVADILALYYLSLSLQESPSTANNVGILLAGVQNDLSTQTTQSSAGSSFPCVSGVAPGSGLALALAYYQYGLRLDPKHVHLHTNLGSLLKDIGQLDLAIQMYEQAVACDGTFDIALTNLANAVKDRGRIQDAILYYKRAVKSNPDFAEAVCGLFTASNSVCDWRGRGGVLLPDKTHDRWHVNEDGILFDAHVRQQATGLSQRVAHIVKIQLQEASRWGLHTLRNEVLEDLAQQLHGLYDGSREEFVQLLQIWVGKPWEGSRIVRLVERAGRVLQRRWYVDQRALTGKDAGAGTRLQHSQPGQYRRPRLPGSLTVPPAPTVLPFHTFTCPLAASDVRGISQRNGVRISCSTMRSSWISDCVYPPPSPPAPHLNVGYLSSDFNNHPLAHLMQSVFGFHNRRRVKAHCYATTLSDGSIHRLKIEQEAPVFRDVSSWSPSRLIQQITQDNIHVLVNLNGYTRGARNEIFAARPAPIQMSFMGFAGSLGAEWCDYLLADTTAVPPSTLRPWRGNVKLKDVLLDDSEKEGGGWIYSENVIFCRDTFFCCDHAQSAGTEEREITWPAEERRRWQMRKTLFPTLDDDTVIMGNFNQLYKIEPTTFRTWLRILDKVPKAVLWLLRFPEPGEHYLKATAKAWAGEEVAKRLVFTDVAPKSQHISRARVCDLFLDTPECNAHTTAADVLWSSTPLLTLPRYSYKMCSRMAASILRGALPKDSQGEQASMDLIASSEEHYEELAVLLAGGLTYDVTDGVGHGRGRLAELRKVLWESKWTCGLFNTRRWVADLECAYEEAWRRWVEDESGDIYL